MSNTINVNYMTRAYNQYQQKNAAKDQEKEDTRFADSVREKSEASGSIVGNSKIGSVSAKDMTMVEYKQYIYNSDKLIGGIEVCTLVLVRIPYLHCTVIKKAIIWKLQSFLIKSIRQMNRKKK